MPLYDTVKLLWPKMIIKTSWMLHRGTKIPSEHQLTGTGHNSQVMTLWQALF